MKTSQKVVYQSKNTDQTAFSNPGEVYRGREAATYICIDAKGY